MAPAELEERDFAHLRHQMVEFQLRRRGIADPKVLRAMECVPRHRFVSERVRWAAYDDEPLPIGLGQTISQPYIVARMTELLQIGEASRVLEIGTGSGYQAAVLAEIAREVWSIERHVELAVGAREILRGLGYETVHVVSGDGTLGLPEHAPYDGILVAAAAPVVPAPLPEQLADGGRLVIPVGDAFSQLLRIVIRTGDTFRERDLLGVRFVPLVGEKGYPSEEGR